MVALDDGRLEGRAAEFRHDGLDLSGPDDELSSVAAAAVGLPARRPLAALGPDGLGRLMTGRRPCSAMRLSICGRNYASPTSSE